MAHYGVLTKDPRLDVVLTFVDDVAESSAEAWSAGEVGGFEAYLLADEDKAGAAAEEVYRVQVRGGGPEEQKGGGGAVGGSGRGGGQVGRWGGSTGVQVRVREGR